MCECCAFSTKIRELQISRGLFEPSESFALCRYENSVDFWQIRPIPQNSSFQARTRSHPRSSAYSQSVSRPRRPDLQRSPASLRAQKPLVSAAAGVDRDFFFSLSQLPFVPFHLAGVAARIADSGKF